MVGICFDREFKNIFISDVFGKRFFKCSLDSNCKIDKVKSVELFFPEYIVVAKNGNAFVTLPDGLAVAQIIDEGEKLTIGKQIRTWPPNTVAFGEKDFGEKFIYIVFGGGEKDGVKHSGKVYRAYAGIGGK